MAKAISIIQPHASLIANGIKHIETRSWKTNYRGRILIHASKTRIPKMVKQNTELMSLIGNPNELPFGFLVCEAKLVDCLRIDQYLIEAIREVYPTELVCGYYSEGRYAWFLEDVNPIDPVPVKGHLGIWNY